MYGLIGQHKNPCMLSVQF